MRSGMKTVRLWADHRLPCGAGTDVSGFLYVLYASENTFGELETVE